MRGAVSVRAFELENDIDSRGRDMNKRLRPIPYPVGSKYRQTTIKYFVVVLGKTHGEALARIRDANQRGVRLNKRLQSPIGTVRGPK